MKYREKSKNRLHWGDENIVKRMEKGRTRREEERDDREGQGMQTVIDRVRALRR